MAQHPQMTILEILNRTKFFFEKKGIPDSRLDAEYIISFGLKMKNRMDLYLNFEKPLTNLELDSLRPLVARRANREPIQHIIGDTSFRGYTIKCDKRALIPRPETEEIVDIAKDLLKSTENPFILDIGTGTGAIAIALAKEVENSKIFATDISLDALDLAKENALLNELLDKEKSIHFEKSDLLDLTSEESKDFIPKVDCLIANLPYIPDSEKGKLQPEVDKFDPPLALFGGNEGLDLIRRLLNQTQNKLHSGAFLILEIGSEQGEILKNEIIKYPWLEFLNIHNDFCGNIRFISFKMK